MPNSIHEVVNDNEKAIAVFTTHDELQDNIRFNEDGTGYTGDWKMRLGPNTVVIYHRINGSNNIYKADVSDIEGPLEKYLPKKKRYRIHFNNCVFLGATEQNWPTFGDTGSYPVRYINA